jgi:hypothetical protein
MKTSYSRHELYALGEPLGDSVTRKEVGRVIYGGGGGGAPTQTTSNVNQSNVPAYAQPYVENMLSSAQKQIYKEDGTTFQPYKAYGGTYDAQGNQTSYDPSKGIAGFQPLQTTAQQGIQGLKLPGQFDTAMTGTQNATNALFGTAGQAGGYGAQGVQSGMQGQNLGMQGGQYYGSQGAQSGMQGQGLGVLGGQYYGAQGAGYGAQAANAGNQYAQQATNPYAAQAYMSPYMQNVVDVQKREAGRQSAIQGTQQQAQAAQAGAFGGGRDAIMRAERERNLGTQMNDIQAQGSQNAFQQAQQAQQFGANLGLQGMQAGMQGAQTGLQGIQAGLQGTAQGMQGAQTGLQGVQTGLQGTAQGMQGAQTGLQGVGVQQAGYGQAMQGSNQLANIANQQLQAQQGIYGLQNQVGGQQQALEQQKLNQAQQDYANAQQYPMMQLGTLSNMLRGLPMQSTSTQQYQAQPNYLTQGIGAAGSLTSLYNAYNPKPAGAAGGLPSEFKYASGGITSIPRYDVGGQVMSQLEQMDDQSLAREAKESPSPEIKRMAQAILKQRQAGMDTAPQMDMAPQPQQDMGMAGGGIIAFADGRKVDEAEAARAKNQTDMYIQAAQQAAAERQAQETTAGANADAPMGMGTPPKPSLMKGINAALESVASKVSRPAPASMMADTTEAPAGITAARRSPRAAEFAATRNPTPTVAPKAGPAPAPVAEPVAPFKEMSADALKAYEDAAAGGNTEAANALQAYYKKFPQAAPPAAPNSIMAAAPTSANGIPAVDLPEFMKKEREQIVTDQGKTTGTYFDQLQQEMKDRGLSNDEARQQYMKDAMASKANLQADAERTKQLRLAEFFASWGSTPGDTLSAGMKALKDKIPDMIGDAKDQRKALAEANDLIYKIGEATRQEQLGNWDKATKLKEAAAGRAEKFNERLTQYMYHVQDTVMQTQTSRANALTQATSAANVADIHGMYQIAAANITDRTRQVAQEGQLDIKQQTIIDRSAHNLDELAKQLEANNAKPNSPYALAVKAIQDAGLVSDPESPLKKKAIVAQKFIDDTKAEHERTLSAAWQRTENLFKKYAGPNYVPGINPYASSTMSNHPTDIKALIDQFAVPAKK